METYESLSFRGITCSLAKYFPYESSILPVGIQCRQGNYSSIPADMPRLPPSLQREDPGGEAPGVAHAAPGGKVPPPPPGWRAQPPAGGDHPPGSSGVNA